MTDRRLPHAPPPPAARRPEPSDAVPTRTGGLAWVRRLGVAGFLFFLVKGLAWLAVPWLLVVFGVQC